MKANNLKKGLYVPSMEHDACGIGLIANIDGTKTFENIGDALSMLENMEHRGGRGANPKTGDGAGIHFQIPHSFFRSESIRLGFSLPSEGQYGVAMVFFPNQLYIINQCDKIIHESLAELGLKLIGERIVPVDRNVPGPGASEVEPFIKQLFIGTDEAISEDELERKLFVFRNYSTHKIGQNVVGNNRQFYLPSCSARTIVYKGQLRTDQLRQYYPDLQNKKLVSGFAMIHSRFSTNTFPNWKLAQPFRYMAHNGEINTIRGNVNKMKSKEALFQSSLFSDAEIAKLLPLTNPDDSDSANLDAMVEMLVLAGRPLAHVMMMLVPEAWQNNELMDPKLKAFYKFHAAMMEPWDGPAALVFTDGRQIGAALDRNGLRPLRYAITHQGRMIMASEAGALPIAPEEIKEKGRITPGKMMIVDLKKQKVAYDDEVKTLVSEDKEYLQWIEEERIKLKLEPVPADWKDEWNFSSLLQRQQAYGYTSEDLKVILAPMAEKAYEALGSMGDDTPLAVLSKESRHISHYFKQHFAQVSNPPIDPIRERLVMSLFTRIGASQNVLEESRAHTQQIHISQPVLLNSDLAKLRSLESKGFPSAAIQALFNADGEPGRLQQALSRICADAEKAIKDGKKILVISDKGADKSKAPIPSLIAIGAIHHHLVEKRIRTKAGLILEAGDIWEVHHYATAIGYGASAVNPYLALESIVQLNESDQLSKKLSVDVLMANYVKAVGNGLLKVMSKMGISTLQSYQSSQIFEALGLGVEVVDLCFKGTVSRIDGLSLDDLAKEVLIRHQVAFNTQQNYLETGGIYQWKRKGEKHLFNPETIHLLQHSTKGNRYDLYKKYAQTINTQTQNAFTLRGLLELKKRVPISINEVEPVESILKRFVTGAMSFGSISHEAHTTLAIAMNRIGAKSNSGEGGEDEVRYAKKENGDWERSATKQVASGRFGVTSHYLANADEIQIKMAQGAKPGEGGQLPGHKVDGWIGRVRHSTPGVGLISPPPHHDIYSIEDLAQLIYDLKNANQNARINVKLVSQTGVGTVAAGVAKAKAEAILISGADGGTGASPISSVRHTGLPWEMGLSEAHQTLVKNNLRNRVVLQTDGQIRTGYDIAVATLLGAEEWGVATAALVVEGCIMMRKCHLNTCPVGIATQDPDLRKLFTGNPDHVVNFFYFLAQDFREIMAELGFRTVNEMVGRTDALRIRQNLDHWKLKKLDLSGLLFKESSNEFVGSFRQIDQDFELEHVLDRQLIETAQPALDFADAVKASFKIQNTDRSVGAMLSYEISKKYAGIGLPADTLHYQFKGSAGQSFGVFATRGITFELEGEANDYFGKGLSGARLVVYPDKKSTYVAEQNIIIGNVAFYGATSGEAYIRGMAGERFCVRNSGVQVVVEGVGDHACEYMTGGRVLILGNTGKNFAAGMSGGIAYVLDPEKRFANNCNKDMVLLESLDEDDQELIRNMMSKHVAYTHSEVAQNILDHWDQHVGSFVKVMPEDYKAVLAASKASSKEKVQELSIVEKDK